MKLLMENWRGYLAEGLSDIVYHGTSLASASKIIQANTIFLSTAFTRDWEQEKEHSKGKYFYLSLTRSPGMFKSTGMLGLRALQGGAAIFVLDGRKLGQKYKGGAMDYFHKTIDSMRDSIVPVGPRTRTQHDEMEDRLVSDDPTIPDFSKYIKEVRFLLPEKWDGTILLPAMKTLEQEGVPYKILTDDKYLWINNPKEDENLRNMLAQYLDGTNPMPEKGLTEREWQQNISAGLHENRLKGMVAFLEMVIDKGEVKWDHLPTGKDVQDVAGDLRETLRTCLSDGWKEEDEITCEWPTYGIDERGARLEEIKNNLLQGIQTVTVESIEEMEKLFLDQDMEDEANRKHVETFILTVIQSGRFAKDKKKDYQQKVAEYIAKLRSNDVPDFVAKVQLQNKKNDPSGDWDPPEYWEDEE